MRLSLLSWKNWRILPQIIVIAVLPALAMFIAILAFLIYTQGQELSEETKEKGVVTAELVAALSEYAVASGDLAYLAPIFKTLLERDANIVGLRITDAKGVVLIEQGLRIDTKNVSQLTFSAPIIRQTLALDDATNLVLQPSSTKATIGKARLLEDQAPLIKKQRHRILVGSLIEPAPEIKTPA